MLLHSHIRRSESRWLDQIVESLSSDDYFVIMGGSNDILSDETGDSSSIFANMNLSLIEESNSLCKLIIVEVPPIIAYGKAN